MKVFVTGVAVGVAVGGAFLLGQAIGRKSVWEGCVTHRSFVYDDELWVCTKYRKEPKVDFPSLNSKGELLTWQRN